MHVSPSNMFVTTPKVNVLCALSKERAYGSFFMETAISGIVYLDMLQQFLISESATLTVEVILNHNYPR
jgi:hypothetical protein